jgi:hypothetical protein
MMNGRKEERTRIVNRKKIEWMVSHGTMERRRGRRGRRNRRGRRGRRNRRGKR